MVVIATVVVVAAVALRAAVEDIRSHVLRNRLTMAIAVVTIVGVTLDALWPESKGIELGDLLRGSAIFAGPWLLIHLAQPTGVGFGDIKYGGALGLSLGWISPDAALGAILTVLVVGGIHAAAVILAKRTTHVAIPFGPAILAGYTAEMVTRLT